MSDLNAIWIAEFTDGSQLKQFDESGENKYQNVLARHKDLAYFHLFNWSTNIWFTVDLQRGLIFYSFNQKPTLQKYLAEETLAITKTNIRLIYFRRTRVIGVGHKVEKIEKYYFLGYQYIDSTGANKKVIFQIDNDGNFVIGE